MKKIISIMPTVCYITKKDERYLAYYHYNKEKAQQEVDKLNKDKPCEMKNGVPIDWNDTKEFFVSEQEEMY